jgi:EpsI family protein
LTHKSALSAATIAMLTTALLLRGWTLHRAESRFDRPLVAIPSHLGVWHLTAEQELPPGVQGKLRATSYLSRTYTNGPITLDLLIAYYATQRAGESMHSPKHCLPGAGWDISGHQEIAVTSPGYTAVINRYAIQKGAQHAATLYWYQSQDRIIASEYKAKLVLAYDSIWRGKTDGSLVRIVFSEGPEQERAAEEFAKLMIPEMQKCLRSTSKRRSTSRMRVSTARIPLFSDSNC